MEKIFDLLAEEESPIGLNLRETKKNSIYVENLRKKKTENVLEVL